MFRLPAALSPRVSPRRVLLLGVLGLSCLGLASAAPAAEPETETLKRELEEIQARLRHLKRTGASPELSEEDIEAERLRSQIERLRTQERIETANAFLPAWHVNLSKAQRTLLMQTIAPMEFAADDAADPESCLRAFQAAVKQTRNFDEIVVFLDRKRRRRYLLTEGHPDYNRYAQSDAEWIEPLKTFLTSIVRVDETLLSPDRDDRAQVLVWTQKGSSYGLYRIAYVGEGKLWRLAGYKFEKALPYLPAEPIGTPGPTNELAALPPSETNEAAPTDLTADAPGAAVAD